MFVVIHNKNGVHAPDLENTANKALKTLGESVISRQLNENCLLAWNDDESVSIASDVRHAVFGSGTVFGDTESGSNVAELLLKHCHNGGNGALASTNGHFAGGMLDLQSGMLTVVRDQLGIEPLYYAETDAWFVFSTSARVIGGLIGSQSLDHTAVARFLCFNYNPGRAAVWEGVRKFPAGHRSSIRNGRLAFDRYWTLQFSEKLDDSESEIVERLRTTMVKAILVRSEGIPTPAVFVSGGLDSSTVLGVIAKHRADTIHTFSYRCRGVGFDESHYAKLMAESTGSNHNELEYRPEKRYNDARPRCTNGRTVL